MTRGSTATSLGFGTCLLACYLLSYQTVNLGIQGSIFLLLLGNDILNGLLLFLQCLHHVLLLGLLAFQGHTLTLTPGQQLCFALFGNAEFEEFLVDLLLLGLDLVALYVLVGGIFTHEA